MESRAFAHYSTCSIWSWLLGCLSFWYSYSRMLHFLGHSHRKHCSSFLPSRFLVLGSSTWLEIQRPSSREPAPNLSLNSDPACIVFHSFSTFRFLGFAQRLGAGGAGYLPSLGRLPGLRFETRDHPMRDKRRLLKFLSMTMVVSLVAFYCLLISFLLTALFIPKAQVPKHWSYYWLGAAVLIASINLIAKFIHQRLRARSA